MLKSKKSAFIIVGVVSVIIILLSIGSTVLAYGITQEQWQQPIVRKIASITHFPAARVGSHWISYTDYLEQSDAQRIYIGSAASQADGLATTTIQTTAMRQAALDQLIKVAAIEDLAIKYKVNVTPTDVDQAFTSLVDRAGTSTSPGEIQAYLKDSFGWTEADFKNYVVYPALLQSGLEQVRASSTPAITDELNARITQSDVVRYLNIK